MSLSIEEMRRWCLAHTKRGQGKFLFERSRELPTKALLRTLDWDDSEFYKWLHGKGTIPARVRPFLSRFIQDWEAGILAFTPAKRGSPRRLIRVPPKPRKTIFTIDRTGQSPRLALVHRAPPAARMPEFHTLIRPRRLTG